MMRKKISREDILRVAAEAQCDPRTVESTIRGEGRPLVMGRVRRAAERIGVYIPQGAR